MSAEAELTPTSYIQHHLHNLTASLGIGSEFFCEFRQQIHVELVFGFLDSEQRKGARIMQ